MSNKENLFNHAWASRTGLVPQTQQAKYINESIANLIEDADLSDLLATLHSLQNNTVLSDRWSTYTDDHRENLLAHVSILSGLLCTIWTNYDPGHPRQVIPQILN